jgi:hypothetical protein
LKEYLELIKECGERSAELQMKIDRWAQQNLPPNRKLKDLR